MKVQTQIRVCAYMIALLGMWSVTLTEYFTVIWPIAATVVVIVGSFYEGPRRYAASYRRIWLALGVCMLLFFPFDIVLSGRVLLAAIHLSMFAQTYLLLNPKDTVAYRRIFMVSFAHLLASTNLTSGLAFAVFLIAWCALAVYSIGLMLILRGLQTGGTVDEFRPADQRAPKALLAWSLVWTILLTPFTLGFFYSAPRLRFALIARGNNVEVLNQMKRARTLTGFTKTIQLGSYGSVQEDLTLALRVEVPERRGIGRRDLKWRGGAANIYDGTTWSSSRDTFMYYSGNQVRPGRRNAGTIFPRANNLFILDERYARYNSVKELDADPRLVKQVCYLEIPYSDTLFGADTMVAVQGPFRYGLGQDFNRSLFIYNRQALPEFISYTAYSEIHEPDEKTLRQIPAERFLELVDSDQSGHYVRTHFLQVPPGLDPRIRALTLDITKNASTPYDKVRAIDDFLRDEFVYSLEFGVPPAGDPISHFLFESRTGHCEYFATAMTLMTRVIGIPARLARGFQRGEWNEASQFYEVRQRDAHAWVEIYFPGHGWLPFDPSPRAEADRLLELRRSPLARLWSKQLLQLQIQWRKHVVGYNETRRMRLFSQVKESILQQGPQAVVGTVRRLMEAARNMVASHVMLTVLIFIAAVAAFYGYRATGLGITLPWLLPRLLGRGRESTFYDRMLRLLEKRKIVKSDCVTPLEFLDDPALQAHPMSSEIAALTEIYYRVRFGSVSLADDETALINDVLKRLSRSNGRISVKHEENKYEG